MTLAAVTIIATTAVTSMASMQEKVYCVISLLKSKAIVTVLHSFRLARGRDRAVGKTIRHWFNQFEGSGSVGNHKESGRPRISENNVEKIMSCQRCLLLFGVCSWAYKRTIENVLHKRIWLNSYRIKFCVKSKVRMSTQELNLQIWCRLKLKMMVIN
jgi:hypothetical protein